MLSQLQVYSKSESGCTISCQPAPDSLPHIGHYKVLDEFSAPLFSSPHWLLWAMYLGDMGPNIIQEQTIAKNSVGTLP